MPSGDLLVSEVFGPTFQGEGKFVGRRCAFLRLGACNLNCFWCDTPYTWAFDKRHAKMHNSGVQYNPAEEMTRFELYEIEKKLLIALQGGTLIVVSGGEPMLQQDSLVELMQIMSYCDFEIETAGTIAPKDKLKYRSVYSKQNVYFNVSPKLEHSGNLLEKRYKPDVLKELSKKHKSIFKFVVDWHHWEDDFIEIAKITRECHIDRNKIYIMPVGVTQDEILLGMQMLANPILMQGWNLTTRLHTLIWGDERGK